MVKDNKNSSKRASSHSPDFWSYFHRILHHFFLVSFSSAFSLLHSMALIQSLTNWLVRNIVPGF